MTSSWRFKKKTAWCLIGSMLFSVPYTTMGAEALKSRFSDVKGHWAEQAINRMANYKIVNGYNGLFRPNDPITRGEMSVVIDGIMKYQKVVDNTFSDVKEAFYTEALLKAYDEGLLLEDNGLLRPRDNATREEVAYMIYNAFDIEKSEKATTFTDESTISDWAKEAVTSLAAKGILVGSDGKFRPQDSITRGEAVTILNRILGEYYSTEGTYNGYISGNVVVNAADTHLKDAVITGDLIIAEGVAEGDIILENVVVEGRTIIKGGGIHSIKVKGTSALGNVVMAKDDSPVRLVVDETAKVSHVVVAKESADVIVAGTMEQVTFEAEKTKLTVQDGVIHNLTIVGETAKVELNGKTAIKTLNVAENAMEAQITVEKEATVNEVSAKAKTTIEGTGKVEKVKAEANDISVQTKGTEVVAAEGTTGVMAGKEPVKGGTTSQTTKPSGGNSSSNNSNNSNNNENNNGSNDNEEDNNTNEPTKEPLNIVKVESVTNGLVRLTLNQASEKAFTIDQIHIICNSGGKDMTILDVSTQDNKVYDIKTSFYDDNTYVLSVLLSDGTLLEKEFVSKYDCAEISSMQMTRTGDGAAELTFVSDAPGTFYYGLSKKEVMRSYFTEEPTAEALIEQGVKTPMDLHLNTIQIEGLEAQVPYTLYYVAVDTTNRVTPVKSIDIAAEALEGPEKNPITIEDAKAYSLDGELFDENNYFVFTLSEPTEEALTLEQFQIVCPADGALTLGRLETKDNQTYTVYMKPGYIFKDRNTFKVTITFKDQTVAEKGFYVDVTAPIITSAKVTATTDTTFTAELVADEPGKLYYKILDHVEQDTSRKDPKEIYETGKVVDLSYGTNILTDLEGLENKWFCYATEDQYGNRQSYFGYKQIPQYVAPEEPEQPDENPVAITEVVYNSSYNSLTVSFNQFIADNRVDKDNITITGTAGKLLLSTYWDGEKFKITIVNGVKIASGTQTLRLIIDGKTVEGKFTVQ